jgi:hypothetical protein
MIKKREYSYYWYFNLTTYKYLNTHINNTVLTVIAAKTFKAH